MGAVKRAADQQLNGILGYTEAPNVSMDFNHDEIVLLDENLFQILAYDRTANTPPQAAMTEPKRVLGGLETKIEFQCGLYIDPNNGDIYAVNNDTVSVTGHAAFNVEPDQVARYFDKLQCFCFQDQTLAAGETRQFPVQYFIAPELATDREAKGAREITLSYTFYPSVDAPTGPNA